LQIVPGLKLCVVQETAQDQSWQRIRQVMDYAWFTPRVSYDVLASYNKPERHRIRKIAGDPDAAARLVGLAERRRIHGGALRPGIRAGILDAALVLEGCLEAGFAEDAARVARACGSGSDRLNRGYRGA
jgi:hypothetical protein